MAMQQQQMAMQQQHQQQMPPPMAAVAPQQVAQAPAAQGGDAQQQQAQAQPQPQPLAQAASGALPTASSAGGATVEVSAAQQPDAAQQAQQVTVAQVAPQQAQQTQQAQQAQQGAVVPPGMMLVPIPAGGPPAVPAQAYPAAHPYYGMKAEGSMDPGMAPSGSGTVAMGGGYMMAPAGSAAGMGVAAAPAMPAMSSLPQVMPANVPPVAWLPAPDISQDGKLRPPAA